MGLPKSFLDTFSVDYPERFHTLLISALNGEEVSWPANADRQVERDFLRLTCYHGVQTLLLHQLKTLSIHKEWPTIILEKLQREVANQSVLEMLQQSELLELFDVLAKNDIYPLMIKGTPLSYTHYPSPILRPHADIDLLIPPDREMQFKNVIIGIGYYRAHSIDGKIVTHQEIFQKQSSAGIELSLDCHWKISNPQYFSSLLTYEELMRRSVTVSALGPHARTLCPEHALLLACLHRVAHHSYESSRLIWLYDIHLLSEQMNSGEFRAFGKMAVEKQLRAVCYAGLKEAQSRFRTRLFDEVIEGWEAHLDEPTAAYLNEQLRRLDLLRFDLGRLSGLQKIKLLKEHLFPSQKYMMEKYSTSSRVLLPALYLHRAVAGIIKFYRRP